MLETVEDGGIFVAHIARCGIRSNQIEPSKTGGIILTMSHTHTNLLSHVVFSTQCHLPLINSDVSKELFAYMGGLIKEQKGKPVIINGMSDHVHLLILLPPSIHLSETMRL